MANQGPLHNAPAAIYNDFHWGIPIVETVHRKYPRLGLIYSIYIDVFDGNIEISSWRLAETA